MEMVLSSLLAFSLCYLSVQVVRSLRLSALAIGDEIQVEECIQHGLNKSALFFATFVASIIVESHIFVLTLLVYGIFS